jgi:enoyl-CoA hydratase/carnithine racemase
MTTSNDILTQRSGPVLEVSFNRPSKKNALISAMYSALADLLNESANDDSVHVVLLYGQGDSFTAGNDLADFQANPPGAGDSPQARLIDAMINFDKPLIAAVHGVAVGAGTTMLGHFDLVYAAESAKFNVPFVNLGLVPEFASSYLLPSQLGYHAIAEIVLLAQPFDARRASDVGLVTRVVPDQDLLATAREAAAKLADKPIGALRASKGLLKRASREQAQAANKEELQEFAARVRSAEAKEAFAAFFAKRRPDANRTKSPAAAAASAAK